MIVEPEPEPVAEPEPEPVIEQVIDQPEQAQQTSADIAVDDDQKEVRGVRTKVHCTRLLRTVFPKC